MKKLELLSPARDLECGIAAINHGADAVYIGASKFGARKSAGNSMADIEELVKYGGKFNVPVYLTLNTILLDSELNEAERIAHDAWNAGVSALIVQDMAFMEMALPPIRLFASTQTDNRTPEKVLFLEKAGFDRVILARELSIDEIKIIRAATTVDLEAFVQGAVCYSYSGRCYLSSYIGGRSANRGECGQPCRLKWDLKNESGSILVRDKHILSLKDMCRSDYLEDLIDAGITSFKIEGRLKDTDYVKNITSFYRKKLDELMEKRNDLRPSSSGKTSIFFDPDPYKTFNRGLHTFFPDNKGDDTVFSINTPKSLGKRVGVVKRAGQGFIEIESKEKISNGDGLCCILEDGTLIGFMVEKTEGLRIYPASDVSGALKKGMTLFRNRDHEFLKILSSHKTSERKIGLEVLFYETADGFGISASDEDGISAGVFYDCEKIKAEKPEQALKNIETQLSKLGESIFYMISLEIRSAPYFIQVKNLNHMRRDLICEIEKARAGFFCQNNPERYIISGGYGSDLEYPIVKMDYSANVSNQKAREFYLKHGITSIDPAFEISSAIPEDAFFMHSRHCILKEAGLCGRNQDKNRYIIENRTHSFEIITDCSKCEMYIKRTDPKPKAE